MFEQLVEKLPVGICMVDEEYRLVYLNAFLSTVYSQNGEKVIAVSCWKHYFLNKRNF